MRTTALLGLGFALWAGNAQALGPFQVYEQALRNDPEFLAALQERDAGQESRTIGRAGLLPKLSYNYNKGRNNSRATYLNERGNSHEDRNYNSYGSTFTVQQPLIDYEAYANYRKGVAQALFAQDQIDNARAKKNAYEQQFQQNEQLFRQGEGTRTDILEAESRYELATAEQLQAQDEQDAALRELGALIGVATVNIDELTPLPVSFSALPLQPASFSSWHTMALESNPLLASQREALEVARYEVERNRAGHLPKLNAYASVRKMESESGNTYNQRYDTNTIGIEISLPLYAGGGVAASVRQASSNLARVEYELEGKTRETLIELRRQFNACQSGVSKLRAYQKALVSAEALVVSTRQSILGGERVNLDALNAEQQLYSTRRDLAQARYDYLLAWTKLHFYAGTLGEQDLARVDEVFVPREPATVLSTKKVSSHGDF